jgi:hypothetical protein
MPTLHDLIEVSGFSPFTTITASGGDILGTEDNVFWNGFGDIDEGDDLTIGGVTYNIDQIYEPSSNLTMETAGGTETFSPASESNLNIMMLEVSNGATTRFFLLPNDSYGDLSDISSITFGGITDVAGSDAYINAGTNNNVEVVCFAGSTCIQTDQGRSVPIHALNPGDKVLTADNGAKEIVWIGKRHLYARDLRQNPSMLPVRIAAGALGDGVPATDLLVSPQHRVLVRSVIAKRMFGETEILVAAKQLCGINGIQVARTQQTVSYFHLLFDQHEVIFADGAMAESLHLGPRVPSIVHPSGAREIYRLFPEIREPGFAASAARKLVKGPRAKRLTRRMEQNRKPLQNPLRLFAGR